MSIVYDVCSDSYVVAKACMYTRRRARDVGHARCDRGARMRMRGAEVRTLYIRERYTSDSRHTGGTPQQALRMVKTQYHFTHIQHEYLLRIKPRIMPS